MPEHGLEPIPGLPGHLPEGEFILWQGAPEWKSLARYAFHTRAICGYFLLLILIRVAYDWADGTKLPVTLVALLWIILLAVITVLALYLSAWIMARAALYTITNERVVMRIGAAISITINLPFAQVENADLKMHKDGTGDISLLMGDNAQISWILCWPHVRGWRFNPAQPMLRCINKPQEVADLLGNTLRGFIADKEEEPVQGTESLPHVVKQD